MESKLKKIITASIVGTFSIVSIGCSTSKNTLAKHIDKSMADFVSSINNLDYVDTSTPSKDIGKIIETSSTDTTTSQYLNNTINHKNVENTIISPSEHADNFKLFVLSDTPFISLTSDNSASTLNLNLKFSTGKIEESSNEINDKINSLILKRSILMIYVNEIYNGNVNFTEENKTAINAYINVIKENTSFLNGNRGMVKNQLNLANNLVQNESNNNLINYYIIKSGEALETRSNKIDSTISAIDSIIDIIEASLTNASSYYQANLNDTYKNLVDNMNNQNIVNPIADSIAESLNFKIKDASSENQNDSTQNTTENPSNSLQRTISQNNQNTLNTNNNLSSDSSTDQNNISRRTRRISRRTRKNTQNQNNFINNETIQSRNTTMDNETESRQLRTLENRMNEEYTSTKSMQNNHITRVPHTTTSSYDNNTH